MLPYCFQDIEICVPESLHSKAVSILCSTGLYQLTEKDEYDIFTEYKRGYPTLAATSSNLQVVIFPDTHFYLAPLHSSIVSYKKMLSPPCSHEIQDLVAADEIRQLPMPRLPPYFIGLCRRFLESNDDIARIAVEQLVDGMHLDDEWVYINLGDAPRQVRELAMRLVAERPSRCDEFLDLEVLGAAVDYDRISQLRMIPGSGY